jgi:hypothetical protein
MDMFAGPVWSIIFLIPFLFPQLARTRHDLWRYALMAFVPMAFLAAIAVAAGIGSVVVGAVGFGAAAFLGTLARRASLLAYDLGHPRPYSLWIELLFLGLLIGFLRLVGLLPA